MSDTRWHWPTGWNTVQGSSFLWVQFFLAYGCGTNSAQNLKKNILRNITPSPESQHRYETHNYSLMPQLQCNTSMSSSSQQTTRHFSLLTTYFHCKIHHSIQKPACLLLYQRFNTFLGSVLLLVGLLYGRNWMKMYEERQMKDRQHGDP